MTANNPGRSRKRRVFMNLLALIAGGIVVGGVAGLVVDALSQHQRWQERRVAYAATATALAHPSPTDLLPPTPLTETSASSATPVPVLLPTAEDLRILSTAIPISGTLSTESVPPAATLYPQHYTYDLVNFLILGSDRREPTTAYRTDVIVIVSINRTAQTVNLLSIPRDLYVYIPGWGMDRINTAELHQTQTHHSAHRLGLLAETIEYNLGVRLDHVVRIDFAGFETLVNMVNGISIPVDCPVSGFQLVEDGSSSDATASWQPFTLEPGVHDMDGEMALWYVRQRIDSSDFDRNRRQQIVLRALWQKLKDGQWADNIATLWDSITQSIDTDLSFAEAVTLLPIFLNLNANRIEGHYLGLDEVDLGQTASGASVLLVDPEPLSATIERFLTPPTENRLARESAVVNVLNASSFEGWDQLVSARLQAMGILAFPRGSASTRAERTAIYDHVGTVKGSSLEILRAALPNSAETFMALGGGQAADFTVVVGEDYQPCGTTPWKAFYQPD